eukprot:364933-Chlamydomonas_euryale.AAC.9
MSDNGCTARLPCTAASCASASASASVTCSTAQCVRTSTRAPSKQTRASCLHIHMLHLPPGRRSAACRQPATKRCLRASTSELGDHAGENSQRVHKRAIKNQMCWCMKHCLKATDGPMATYSASAVGPSQCLDMSKPSSSSSSLTRIVMKKLVRNIRMRHWGRPEMQTGWRP